MKDIFDILKEFLPLWLVLPVLVCLGLIYFYINITKTHIKYLKDELKNNCEKVLFHGNVAELQKKDVEYLCAKIEEIKIFYSQRLDNLHCSLKEIERTSTHKNKHKIAELQKEIDSIKYDCYIISIKT